LIKRLPENSWRTSTQAISVPVTMFSATTASETSTVKRIAANACALVTASQNAAGPPVDSAATAASGIRTIRPRWAVASAPPAAGLTRRLPRLARRGAERQRQPVLTPRLCSIRCLTQSSGSKNFFITASPPPSFVMSNCLGGWGYRFVDEGVDHGAVALLGEDPCAGSEVANSMNDRAWSRAAVVAAIAFSIRIASPGMT
jgi:hypothetical protein